MRAITVSGIGAIDKVSKSGDTMTGPLAIQSDLTVSGRFATVLPSGDMTGATDTTAILAALSTEPLVKLASGIYYSAAPWLGTIAGGALFGSKGSTASIYDGDPPSTGTVIRAASGWSVNGVSTPAVVQAQGDGFHLRDVWIDGTNCPANVDGFNDGAGHKAIGLRNVGVYAATQRGFAQAGSAWHLLECEAIVPGGTGFYGNWTDSEFVNCHAQGCGQGGAGSGWFINGAECKLIGCRADLSQDGFVVDAGTFSSFLDMIQFIGCSTQRNNHRGWKITNSSATGQSARSPVLLAGCVSDADGVNGTLTTTAGGSITGGAGGGGYAGLHAEGSNTVIIAGGFVQTAATRDVAGGCPAYGISTASIGSGPGVPTLISLDDAVLNGITGLISDAAPAAILAKGSRVFGYAGGVYQGTAGTPLTQVTPTPWSALGDVIYGGTGGLPARLAGNTAAQVMSLTQLGTGSVSAAPAWGVLPGQVLACTQYAPGTQQAKTLGTSGITVFAAWDTTNLTTAAVIAPASGKVLVRVSLSIQTNTAADKIFLSLGAHNSVTPVTSTWECTDGTLGVPRMEVAEFLVTGLTPGASSQWDLLGAGTTGTIITILAFAQATATPTQSGGSPVTFTVTAL